MNDEIVAHVRRSYRLMQAVVWGLVLLYICIAGAYFLDWIPPLLALVIVAVTVLFYVPLVRVEFETRFITDRSPAEVRDEFLSVDNPLAILAYALADDGGVDIHENGATYETTQLFGLYTTQTRYETEQRPNGDLLVRSWKNGSESTVATVSVEPADDTGTIVTADGERSGRVTLRSLLLLWVRGTQLDAAFGANDYEIVDDETRYGIR